MLGPHHQLVRRLRRLVQKRDERRSEGVVVAEGTKVVAAALAAGAEIEAIYAAPETDETPAANAVLAQARSIGVTTFLLADGVMARVADTKTPQSLLATVRVPARNLEAVLGARAALVLVDVRDPGNLGAIVRVADATGVGAVICCAGCADWQSPKAVRASAGSVFSLPIADGGDPVEVLTALRAQRYLCVGTAAKGGVNPADLEFGDKTAVVLGNEASGLAPDLGAYFDAVTSIPMGGQTQSLNVATAAAVICYELLRRESPGGGDALR